MADSDNGTLRRARTLGAQGLRRLAGDEHAAKTYEPGRTSGAEPAQVQAGGSVGKRTLAESWGTAGTAHPPNGSPAGVGKATLAESWGAEGLRVQNTAVCSVAVDAARRHLAALTASQTSGDLASTDAAHQLRLWLQTARDAATDDQLAALAELEAQAAPVLAAALTPDVAASPASREQAWTAAAAPIAALLGVDAPIRIDDAATAHGARGLALAGVVHLAPTLAPEHVDARHILAHELVHVAQSRLPQAGSLADAEHEADTLAAALVRGSLPRRPRVGLAAGVAAADTGAKDAKHASQETAPDLGGAPFQLIAGTFDFWIDRAWYGAASDRTVDGSLWIAPSCNLELFAALQQRGELSWVAKAELAAAAREIGIGAPSAETAPVFRMRMTVGAFDAFGLGPSAKPVAAPLADGGFDVVIAIPDVHGAPHRDFVLSVKHKDAILAAIETPTKLTALAAPRAKFLAQTFHATLGNGTTHVVLDGAYCRALFGAAYDEWLVRQASGDPTSTIRPVGMADPTLAPEEVAFVRAWLACTLTASADAAALVVDRRLYTALRALEDLPAEQRALVAHLLAEHTKAQPVSASLLEQLLFEADRAHAGFAEHAANPDARPPTFDYPIPARLDQTSDRVVDGEAVKLRLLIAWPEAATGDQASDYHWRAEVADIDWLFVCNAEEGKPPIELRESSRVHGDGTGIEHRFTVPGHLESAIWKVTAFVRHNLFQPRRLYTEIEVRRVDVAMTELRAKAFAGLGTATAAEDHHDFFPDDTFDAGSYATGILFRGDLPADFTRRNAAELATNVDREIAQTEVLLQHLVDQHLASAAIDASRAHLARLHEIKDAIVEVGQTTVRPFELRGTYLGIGNQLADGALDLIGTTWFGGKLDGAAEMHVEIFDLSRRFDTKTSTFSGAGATFEIAVEAAFLQLCKAYPGGRLAVLAESIDARFRTTGKTIGFELDTGTVGKDVKAAVFDPIVNKVVNIGLSAIMVVFPETAPVLMTVLVAYNESQNVDAALSEYARGALTPGRKVLHLAQFALDVTPLARQAKVFDVGGKLVSVFEHGGVVLLMGVQAQAQIAEIRDTQVAEAAKIYAELVTLQGSTHGSDPRIQAKQAELEARITTIQDATLEVMKESLVDYGTVALPGHLVGPLHEALGRRQVAAMETRGEFIHQDDVAPHYDGTRDAIVGDCTQATPPVVAALVRQRTTARAAKPAPAVYATAEQQAFLDAAAKTGDIGAQRPDGLARTDAETEIEHLGVQLANLVGDASYERDGVFRLALAKGSVDAVVKRTHAGGEPRLRRVAEHVVLEIPVGVTGTALERVVVGKLTELRHAELARARGDKPNAKSDLGEHGAGRALSPQDLAQVAELRLLRVRHDEQVARGARGEEQAARLGAEIGELEARMGLGGDAPGAAARRYAVGVQAEVQNDGARRARVAAELDGTKGHPGVELHSHFFGIVEAEVFRQRAAATRGGDPGSWRQLLETIVELKGPSFQHQMDGEKIATRAVAGDARRIAVDAKTQVKVLVERAKDIQNPADRTAFLRGAEMVAQEACETALAATPETDFNSAYEIRDELVKQTFGGGAVPGETGDQRMQRRYDDLIRETVLELARQGVGYSEQSVSLKKLAGKASPERIAAVIDQLVADGTLVEGQIDIRMLGMTNTRHFGERNPGLPDVPGPGRLDHDGFDRETKQLVDQLADPRTVGKDIGGPEFFELSPAGQIRLRRVYLAYVENATRTGQANVFRPHVGEGAVDTIATKPFYTDQDHHVGSDGNASHYERANANLEAMLEVLEQLRADGLYDPDRVIVRFGHATHADPGQAARMQALGIIAEVNLGSNIATGAVSQREGANGPRNATEQLDDHAFPTLLYYDTPIAISTDAGAVMGTTLAAEYQRAQTLIEDVLAGASTVKVRAEDARIGKTEAFRGVEVAGHPELRELSVYDMTPAERARFTHAYEKLFADAKSYYLRRPKPHGAAGAASSATDAAPYGGAHHVDVALDRGLIPSRGTEIYEGVRGDVDAAAAAYRTAGYRVSETAKAGGVVLVIVTSADGTFTTVLRSWPGDAPAYLPFDPRAASDPTKTAGELRDWYNGEVRRIAALDAQWSADGVSLEERARRAFEVRHHARLAAREQQSPGEVAALELRDAKVYGDADGPSFEALVDMHLGKGLTRAQAYQHIIDSAQRTNESYNERASAGKATP